MVDVAIPSRASTRVAQSNIELLDHRVNRRCRAHDAGICQTAEDQIDLARVIGIVVVLIAFATAKMAAGATPDCFFVAKNGIALARHGSARTRHLLFNNAAELRVKQKRCFVHGIYTGTNFDFS